MSMIENLEKMLAAGKDSALLRFSLGNAYLQQQNSDANQDAIRHLCEAVKLDANYSAAWKLLGKAYAAASETSNAVAAYREGIRAAEANGDKQAAKEMAVFLKRLQPPAV